MDRHMKPGDEIPGLDSCITWQVYVSFSLRMRQQIQSPKTVEVAIGC